MVTVPVLALDVSGRPYSWLTVEEAACHYAKGTVAWELGESRVLLRGGFRAAGGRSELEIAPIIAVAGSDKMAKRAWEPLSLSDRDNTILFARDRMTCGYCAGRFKRSILTRDHIIPRSRGGRDTWTNCVTACRDCNAAKGSKLVHDFRPLVYVPYVPCRFEQFLLSGRNILADQHEFLAARLPAHSRILTH